MSFKSGGHGQEWRSARSHMSANSSMAIGGWLQRKSEEPQMYQKKKGRKERKTPNSEEQASYMAEAVQAAEISGREKCIMSLRG